MPVQLALDGRDVRVKTYLGRCLCSTCWCGRCEACGECLTKHAFTEEDAYQEAIHALDQASHFQHHCKAAA